MFWRVPKALKFGAWHMKTRSATKAQRVEEKEEEAAEPLPLLELSPRGPEFNRGGPRRRRGLARAERPH